MGTVLEVPRVVSGFELVSLNIEARRLTRGCPQKLRHLWVEGS